MRLELKSQNIPPLSFADTVLTITKFKSTLQITNLSCKICNEYNFQCLLSFKSEIKKKDSL